MPRLSSQALDHLRQALARGGASGRVGVVDDARLARQLADEKLDVVGVPAGEALPVGLAAVIAGGLARQADWEQRIAACCDALVPGGLVVLLDRGQPTELSRRALCGGLSAIEQRAAGRLVVTSGRWQPL